jgi:superfamily II DNA or RNA helicase
MELNELGRAILFLYHRQTDREQSSRSTNNLNGRGFNSADAGFLSSLAEILLAGRSLTPKQEAAAARALQKYAGQLKEGGITLPKVPQDDDVSSPKAQDGRLTREGDLLIFYPFTYPTTKAKDLGFKWDPKRKAWVGSSTEERYKGIMEAYRLDDRVGGGPWAVGSSQPARPKPEWENSPHGWVELVGKEMRFYPNVHPSSAARETGMVPKPKEAEGKFYWRSAPDRGILRLLFKAFPEIRLAPNAQDFAATGGTVTLQAAEVSQIAGDPDLKSFQKEAVIFLQGRRDALLALSPRLGKTICTIKSAKYQGFRRILVICPLSLLYNWKAEVKKWWPEAQTVIVHKNGFEELELTEEPTFVITNFDTAVRKLVVPPKGGEEDYRPSPVLKDLEFEAVIFDESVLLKNRKAKRTQAAAAIRRVIPVAWELSGGPTTKYLDDLWSQFNILDPKVFSSYWRFARRYCNLVTNQWGTSVVGNQEGAFEWMKGDCADVMFSRSMDQVLDIPDWEFEDLEIEMAPEQEKAYYDLQRKFLAHLRTDDGREVSVFAPNVLAQMTRLIQIASNPTLLSGGDGSSPKWEAALEMMDFVELPVIIWTNFVETANRVGQALEKAGWKVGILTGETGAERQDIVDAFGTGQLDAIVAHPAVGKFGFNMAAGRTAIYLERSFNGDDYYQSLHRIRGMTTEQPPRVIHLLSVGQGGKPTIDHLAASVLDGKRQTTVEMTIGKIEEVLCK